MMMFIVILLVALAGVVAYLLMKPKTRANTNTGSNTGRQPLPAPPMGPYGLGYGGVGMRNPYPALPGGDPNERARLQFGASVFNTVGNLFGNLAKGGVFGGRSNNNSDYDNDYE